MILISIKLNWLVWMDTDNNSWHVWLHLNHIAHLIWFKCILLWNHSTEIINFRDRPESSAISASLIDSPIDWMATVYIQYCASCIACIFHLVITANLQKNWVSWRPPVFLFSKWKKHYLVSCLFASRPDYF